MRTLSCPGFLFEGKHHDCIRDTIFMDGLWIYRNVQGDFPPADSPCPACEVARRELVEKSDSPSIVTK